MPKMWTNNKRKEILRTTPKKKKKILFKKHKGPKIWVTYETKFHMEVPTNFRKNHKTRVILKKAQLRLRIFVDTFPDFS